MRNRSPPRQEKEEKRLCMFSLKPGSHRHRMGCQQRLFNSNKQSSKLWSKRNSAGSREWPALLPRANSKHPALSTRNSNFVDRFVGPYYPILWRCEPGFTGGTYTSLFNASARITSFISRIIHPAASFLNSPSAS